MEKKDIQLQRAEKDAQRAMESFGAMSPMYFASWYTNSSNGGSKYLPSFEEAKEFATKAAHESLTGTHKSSANFFVQDNSGKVVCKGKVNSNGKTKYVNNNMLNLKITKKMKKNVVLNESEKAGVFKYASKDSYKLLGKAVKAIVKQNSHASSSELQKLIADASNGFVTINLNGVKEDGFVNVHDWELFNKVHEQDHPKPIKVDAIPHAIEATIELAKKYLDSTDTKQDTNTVKTPILDVVSDTTSCETAVSKTSSASELGSSLTSMICTFYEGGELVKNYFAQKSLTLEDAVHEMSHGLFKCTQENDELTLTGSTGLEFSFNNEDALDGKLGNKVSSALTHLMVDAAMNPDSRKEIVNFIDKNSIVELFRNELQKVA